MTSNTQGAFEVDSKYYDELTKLHVALAQAERDLTLYTDGLSALEKRLMIEADEKFYQEFQKRLPEYLQRRDAKSNPDYITMVRAKASAMQDRVELRGRIDIMDKKFEEWRTRSANRRFNM